MEELGTQRQSDWRNEEGSPKKVMRKEMKLATTNKIWQKKNDRPPALPAGWKEEADYESEKENDTSYGRK